MPNTQHLSAFSALRRHQLRRLTLLVVLALGLLPTTFQPPTTGAQDGGTNDRVAALMASLTLEQKVGQLFMVSFYSSRLLDSSQRFIREYHPGAVAMFGSNLDFQSPAETTALVNHMQRLSMESSGVPLLVAVDQEGGRVWRLVNGFTRFPQPYYLTAANNPQLAREVGQAMGAELGAVGINMNLAPVVDLTTRDDALDDRRVLYQRTMGSDPQRVGTTAGYIAQGLADRHVIGVVKHFPGHSPTQTDSHIDLPVIDMDAATFAETNLLAFREAIAHGAQVVMVGHLYYPQLEPEENLPASLSPTMIGYLRDHLGFEGVIMTDALDMGAIQKRYTTPEAAVMALNAGVDLIATGPNMPFRVMVQTVERVREAVRSGEIPAERFDQAVERVLRLKAEHGLLDWQPLDPNTAISRIPVEQTAAVLVKAFTAGVTVAYDAQGLLPVPADRRTVLIRPGGFQPLSDACGDAIAGLEQYIYNREPTAFDINAASTLGREADIVIVIIANLHENELQKALLQVLPPDKTVVVSLGTPYDWEGLPLRPAAFVAGYSDRLEAQEAVCRVLSGQSPSNGQLPVTLTGLDTGEQVAREAAHD